MTIDAEALDIYQAALAIEEAEAREAFIARRCGGNDLLRARVERMAMRDTTSLKLLPTESLAVFIMVNM